ncbi:hypothetical protein, partial [Glutamicibacter soli]
QRTETPIFSNHIAPARPLKLQVNIHIDFQFSKHGTKQKNPPASASSLHLVGFLSITWICWPRCWSAKILG